MTTDQDDAWERSVQELTRRLKLIVPPSLLADPAAFAAAFKRWETANGWYHRDAPPAPHRLDPDTARAAAERGAALARQGLTRKDQPDA